MERLSEVGAAQIEVLESLGAAMEEAAKAVSEFAELAKGMDLGGED